MTQPSLFVSSCFTYDVFLSFRGIDTRHSFTGNLYNSLDQKSIHTFIDEEEIQKGEEITPSLRQAIQESRIFIVVFSSNYASSTFCLDELTMILECSNTQGRLFIPVFYNVDPSQVRHQSGVYGDALKRHEERFSDEKDKVQKWRDALCQAANVSGWHFQHGSQSEYKFIGNIVEEVNKKINRIPLHVADNPVALESPMLEVASLLVSGSDKGTNMVGIDGIGGVGKSILARGKSFAQVLSASCDLPLNQPLPKVVMGDTVRIKITQEELESGISDCRKNLHGRITLAIGDTPLTTQAMKNKLCIMWPTLKEWNVLPLGRGFFEFQFGSIEDMRKIWALGVVNLKPGLLRFSCWSKAFKTHNQAQTHAQIWVRLMHLPQEYWRRKTLFEIASALGTPLTIDDATLSRRFGIFARILVDVDMSSKLFESVIVDSEGFSLPISVQYERLPPFCAHCKMLGHSTQNCKKLHMDLPLKNVQKTPTVGTFAQQHPFEVRSKNIQTTTNPRMNEVLIPESEALERENLNLIQEQDRAIDAEAVTASIQDQHLDSTLALHNSFTMLDNETDPPDGEAVLMENDTSFNATNSDTVIASKRNIDLPHTNNTETPSELKKRTLVVNVESDQQVLMNGSEQMSLLPSSSSSRQDNKTERLSFLNVAAASITSACDPCTNILSVVPPLPATTLFSVPITSKNVTLGTDKSIVMGPIITPITTTDEILGPDKRPHKGQSVITNNTAACRKSEFILSKFWSDDLDTDQTSDSTLEPDINAEIEGDIEDGSLFTPIMSRRQKQSNKKKHVNKLNDTRVQSTSSEHIQTRSKKGVIKSNPKYL